MHGEHNTKLHKYYHKPQTCAKSTPQSHASVSPAAQPVHMPHENSTSLHKTPRTTIQPPPWQCKAGHSAIPAMTLSIAWRKSRSHPSAPNTRLSSRMVMLWTCLSKSWTLSRPDGLFAPSRQRSGDGAGQWSRVFLALRNRGALSILDASFEFARASFLVSGEPWSTVRKEQRAPGMILCLLRSD